MKELIKEEKEDLEEICYAKSYIHLIKQLREVYELQDKEMERLDLLKQGYKKD